MQLKFWHEFSRPEVNEVILLIKSVARSNDHRNVVIVFSQFI